MSEIQNLIYFAVGLAVGLWQLYVGQKQFEAQQKERIEEVRKSLIDIKVELARIGETSSSRSYEFQDKLLQFALKPDTVHDFQMENIELIKHTVLEELERAGVPDSLEQSDQIERRLVETILNIKKIVRTDRQELRTILSDHELQIIEYVVDGYSNKEIALMLTIQESTINNNLRMIYKKIGLTNRVELAWWAHATWILAKG